MQCDSEIWGTKDGWETELPKHAQKLEGGLEIETWQVQCQLCHYVTSRENKMM